MTREQLIVWAAGFFDGEGSVGLSRSHTGGKVVHLRIRAGQRIREPLERLVMLWGGTIRLRAPRDGYGQFYEWALSNRGSALALADMEPFLIVKLSQARLAREFMTGIGQPGGTRGPGKGNGPLSEEETERREALREAIHVLNQGGKQD